MYGDPSDLAESVGAPLPADYFEPGATSWIAWSETLSPGQRRELRRLLWRQGQIVYWDAGLVAVAISLPWIGALWARWWLARHRRRDGAWR